MLVLDLTPPALPGSSPLQLPYSEPLMAAGLPPSTLTVVEPFFRLLDIDTMTGYGIGTGPPGDGVLHTSGIVDLVMPEQPLWASEFDRPLTWMLTLMPISGPAPVRLR